MRKYENMKKKKKQIINIAKKDLSNLNTISNESLRASNVARDSGKIINNIDAQFEEATKLDDTDISFLFFATALQCIRQYLLTGFKERLTDEDAAKKTKKDKKNDIKESSERSHLLYRPSLEQIISNPVPYDAMYGSPGFNLGLGGNSHRARTLGHDPILGWLFGTANISTSTLTTWDFKSYHIKTGITAKGDARDKITYKAYTNKVLSYTKDRLLNEGMEGKMAFATAILKQRMHFKSDEYSKMGLPLPLISVISPDFAEKLCKYGEKNGMNIDMGNLKTISKQISISVLINMIIAMIHRMFYDENKYDSLSLYEVKTRKILSYSNALSSASNVIYVAMSEDIRKLDIGGIMVTIYRLTTDKKFIRKIKQEFLKEEFQNIVIGEEYDF